MRKRGNDDGPSPKRGNDDGPNPKRRKLGNEGDQEQAGQPPQQPERGEDCGVSSAAEFDVYLAYRATVAHDVRLVERLYDALTYRRLAVFLDRKCLEEGASWQAGLEKGLARSKAFVPVLSRGALAHLANLQANSECDSLLTELRVALELVRSPHAPLEFIAPLLVGDEDKEDHYTSFFGSGCKPDLPDVVVESVHDALVHLLGEQVHVPVPHKMTVNKIFNGVTAYQAVFLKDEANAAFRAAVNKVVGIALSVLKLLWKASEYEMEKKDDPAPKTALTQLAALDCTKVEQDVQPVMQPLLQEIHAFLRGRSEQARVMLLVGGKAARARTLECALWEGQAQSGNRVEAGSNSEKGAKGGELVPLFISAKRLSEDPDPIGRVLQDKLAVAGNMNPQQACNAVEALRQDTSKRLVVLLDGYKRADNIHQQLLLGSHWARAMVVVRCRAAFVRQLDDKSQLEEVFTPPGLTNVPLREQRATLVLRYLVGFGGASENDSDQESDGEPDSVPASQQQQDPELSAGRAGEEFDVFLSYRVEADLEVVRWLCRQLTDRGLKVFLDKESLVTGKSWQEGLEQALVRCRTFVAVVSARALQRFRKLGAKSGHDFLLVEHLMALELLRSPNAPMRAIVPLLLGDVEADFDPSHPVGKQFGPFSEPKLPDAMVVSVHEKVVELLEHAHIKGDGAVAPKMTVHEIFSELAGRETVRLEGEASTALDSAVDVLVRKASPVVRLLNEASQHEAAIDMSVTNGLELYVPLDSAETAEEARTRSDVRPLHHEIYDFLHGRLAQHEQARVMLLLGNAGTGKTLSARNLERALWEKGDLPREGGGGEGAGTGRATQGGQGEEEGGNQDEAEGGDWSSVTLVPLFISLAQFATQHQDPKFDLIQHVLESRLLQSRLTQLQVRNAIETLRQDTSKQLVVMLDGYDEVQGSTNLHERFGLSSGSRWERAKVLVGCRAEFVHQLADQGQLEQRFAAPELGGAALAQQQRSSFVQRYLVGFDKSARQDYITKFLHKYGSAGRDGLRTVEDYETALWEVFGTEGSGDGVAKMLEEPFVLALVLKILPRLVGDHVKKRRRGFPYHRVEVYALFAQEWFERELPKHKRILKEVRQWTDKDVEGKARGFLFDFMRELGLAMHQLHVQVAPLGDHHDGSAVPGQQRQPRSGGDSVEDPKLVAVWQAFVPKQGEGDGEISEEQRKVKVGRPLSPLKRSGEDGNYAFLHKSFQEFFASLEIVRCLAEFPTLHSPPPPPPEQGEGQDRSSLPSPVAGLCERILDDDELIVPFIVDLIRIQRWLVHHAHNIDTDEEAVALAKVVAGYEVPGFESVDRWWEEAVSSPPTPALARFRKATSAPLIEDRLVAVVLASRVGPDGDDHNSDEMDGHSIAAANAMTILNAVHHSFCGADLRGVRVRRSRLDGAQLAGANLSGADLRDVRLRKALLTGANLSKAMMAGVDFGEFPSLKGHSRPVNSVAFSPDGLHIASGSDDGTVRVWGAMTLQHMGTLRGHSDRVNSVAFSPVGPFIASGSGDGTVRVWDASVMEHVHTLGHSCAVNSVAFSPNGSLIAYGSDDNAVWVWDVGGGYVQGPLRDHSDKVRSVAFSPDGCFIASGSDDGTVRVWNALEGRCVAQMVDHIQMVEIGPGAWTRHHPYNIFSVAFSRDGQHIAGACWDRAVRVWDARSFQRVTQLIHIDTVRAVAFSPKGGRIVSGSLDNTVQVWDVERRRRVAALEGHTGRVNSVAFSPDGSRIASGSGDKLVRVWDAKLPWCLVTPEGHSAWVCTVAFSPDGSRIASASEDKTVRVWDAKTLHHVATLEGHSDEVHAVAFSPDGLHIASGSHDNTVRVWDAKTLHHVATLEGHSRGVWSVAFSPDGSHIASGSGDNTVRVWNARTLQHVATLEGHSAWVLSVAFSPNGLHIASGSQDNTVRVWNARTMQCEATLEGHSAWVHSVAFSPDGSHIASGSRDKTVQLWNARTMQREATLEGHADAVLSVAFFRNGSHIVSASEDNTLRVWNAMTRQHVATLEGHADVVNTVACSPDGSRIVSGSNDNTMRGWDANNWRVRGVVGNARPLQLAQVEFADAVGLSDLNAALLHQRSHRAQGDHQ